MQTKDETYIRMARSIAKLSTCPKKQFGAVIVKDDRIISTGTNSPMEGEEHYCGNGSRRRCEDYDGKCIAIHAELKAILKADRHELKGAVLYLGGFENGKPLRYVTPCELCDRVVKTVGIDRVVTQWEHDDGLVKPTQTSD